MTSKNLILQITLLCVLQSVWCKNYIEDLTLTEPQKESLETFKKMVLPTVDLPQSYMKEDFYLIRWLRARNFNLEESKAMLEENLKWRKQNNMDNVHKEDWSYHEKHFPYSVDGRDREGKPILYLDIGAMDFRKEVVTGKVNQLLRWVWRGFEETSGLVRELGNKYQNVSQGILILNIQGFSMTRHGCLRCVPSILSVMTNYETHFPGLFDKIVLLNLPAVAEPILRASRGLLHPETNKILFAYGTNPEVWKKALNQFIDMSELPPELGGTKRLMFNGNEFPDY